MDQYLIVIGIRDDIIKICTAAMYLINIAIVYGIIDQTYQEGSKCDFNMGGVPKEFKQQFYQNYNNQDPSKLTYHQETW